MSSHVFSAEDWEVSSRVWRFGACEFDESSRELWIAGKTVELESKPIEVLYRLLLHAGEIVTKEELFENRIFDQSIHPSFAFRCIKCLGRSEIYCLVFD